MQTAAHLQTRGAVLLLFHCLVLAMDVVCISLSLLWLTPDCFQAY